MPIRWLLIAVGVVCALFGFDRLMLRFEERGWIYYRKRKASPGTLGSAFLSAQAILDPGARHVVEARREAKNTGAEAGDPPQAEAEAGPDRR